MRRKVESTRSMTDKQKYLLNRIPGRYDINGFHPPAEPKNVTAARKLVERHDKSLNKLRCQHEKRNEALIRKAREAVYFYSEEKALAIIRQVEKMLKSCEA